MNNIKRVFTSSFKAKVALDLIRETDSIARLCFVHGIHPTQPGKWKSLAIAGLPAIFDNAPDQRLQEKDDLIENLYRQIGKLQVELDWLKKRPTRHKAETFALLEPSHPDLSIVRQCKLLGVSRSGYYYYQPVPVSERDLLIMRKIDEIYTELPFYGSPRITKELHRQGVYNRFVISRALNCHLSHFLIYNTFSQSLSNDTTLMPFCLLSEINFLTICSVSSLQ